MTSTTADKFRRFGAIEAPSRCPLYAALALRVAEDAALLELADTRQPGQPPGNMLFGAVRYLLQAMPDAALAEPFRSGDVSRDWFPEFRRFCLAESDRVSALLRKRRTQTNEVARCALWLPVLAQVGARADRPITLIEIGASAGLNLQFDRYHYDYGDWQVGPRDSSVSLACAARGQDLARFAMPRVESRHGLDLNPIDPGDADEGRWLAALVWPGKPARETRLRAALRLAAADGHLVETADALERLPTLLRAIDPRHLVCVLHTFVVYQFTPAQRQELNSILCTAAAERDIVRIAIETNTGGDADVTCATYTADGEDNRLLATADAWGEWLDWNG